MGGGCAPSPEIFLTFWLKIVHFGVYSDIYLHLSLLGGGYARPPWGTSRSINWGVDNITGGSTPNLHDSSHPADGALPQIPLGSLQH